MRDSGGALDRKDVLRRMERNEFSFTHTHSINPTIAGSARAAPPGQQLRTSHTNTESKLAPAALKWASRVSSKSLNGLPKAEGGGGGVSGGCGHRPEAKGRGAPTVRYEEHVLAGSGAGPVEARARGKEMSGGERA